MRDLLMWRPAVAAFFISEWPFNPDGLFDSSNNINDKGDLVWRSL
jgi:hypothetical protein